MKSRIEVVSIVDKTKEITLTWHRHVLMREETDNNIIKENVCGMKYGGWM